MSNQIVYTTQNQSEKKYNNQFGLIAEHARTLNLMMPLGYTLLPKNKLQQSLSKHRQIATQPDCNFNSNRKIRKPLEDQNRTPTFTPIDSPKPQVSQLPPKTLSLEMTKCLKILQKLKRNIKSIPFHEPVNTNEVLDYLQIIKQPMDFRTIQGFIYNQEYVSINQFISDIKKIWSNAYTYNAKGSPIYNATIDVEKYFNRILQEEEVYIPYVAVYTSTTPQTSIQTSYSTYEYPTNKSTSIVRTQSETIKKKPTLVNPLTETPLTMQQKRNLGVLIKKLPREYLKGVWEIVSQNEQTGERVGNAQLQFDIEALSVRKARALQQYVKKSFASIEMAKAKQQKERQKEQNLQAESENESSFIIDSSEEDP